MNVLFYIFSLPKQNATAVSQWGSTPRDPWQTSPTQPKNAYTETGGAYKHVDQSVIQSTLMLVRVSRFPAGHAEVY